MAGYERWQKATGNLMRPLIETRFTGPADTHAFGEALMDELIDGKPVKPQGPPLTPEEGFRNRLLRAWTEVDTSVEALKDIEVYMSRFPYGDRVRRSAHIKYHFQNYLNDVYVLKLRLLDYLKIAARCYRRSDPMRATIETAFEPLETSIATSLDGIIKTRGMHVHQHRFDHPDFSRIGALEFFESAQIIEGEELVEAWHGLYLQVYRDLRKKWIKTVRDNNEALSKLLDVVGDKIVDTIFSGPDGAVVLPLHLQPAPPTPAAPVVAAPPAQGAVP